MNTLWFRLAPLYLALACSGPLWAASTQPVHVILWFDTEDYLLPADDDACKRLADLLTARDIRGTFKIVGEKARVLTQRGRQDVIDALRRHDVAYHSDLHSVHPTPTEYLAPCGWLDGIAEFIRREGAGADDVRRIFRVDSLSCYGQPGSSWAPQAVAALPAIGVTAHGVSCYVDEGDHVGLDARPFWYAGALHVYRLGENCTRMDLHDAAKVEPAKRRAAQIADRLRQGAGPGLVSIYYHPCEWVHRQFWDGVNFSRGANPPREQWRPPPQLTAAETDGAFQRFAEYVDYLRALPDVRFVTASDLPVLYPDLVRTMGAPEKDIAELAGSLAATNCAGLDYRVCGGRAYSAADQFELLTRAVTEVILGDKPRFPLAARGLLGPEEQPPVSAAGRHLAWPAFRDAALDARHFVTAQRRVPARVFVGTDTYAPADFLVGLARVYVCWKEQGRLPIQEGVSLGSEQKVLAERHVAADTPGLFGGWVIHREGFRAPRLMELARLQAWSLKPAIPAPATGN